MEETPAAPLSPPLVFRGATSKKERCLNVLFMRLKGGRAATEPRSRLVACTVVLWEDKVVRKLPVLFFFSLPCATLFLTRGASACRTEGFLLQRAGAERHGLVQPLVGGRTLWNQHGHIDGSILNIFLPKHGRLTRSHFFQSLNILQRLTTLSLKKKYSFQKRPEGTLRPGCPSSQCWQ